MKTSIRFFIAALSLSFLSNWPAEQAKRTIACIDGLTPIEVSSGSIPLEADLFIHIQDQNLKKSTVSFYHMLKQTEANYYSGLQTARASYGMTDDLWGAYSPISYTSFDPLGHGGGFIGFSNWGSGLIMPGNVKTNNSLSFNPLLDQNKHFSAAIHSH